MRRPPDRHAKRRPVRGTAAQIDAAAKRHQGPRYDGTPSLPRVVDLRADLHGHVLDYVNDRDRQWFADHPGARRYERAPVAHEWCRPDRPGCVDIGDVISVIVTQIVPGIRTRAPLMLRAAA